MASVLLLCQVKETCCETENWNFATAQRYTRLMMVFVSMLRKWMGWLKNVMVNIYVISLFRDSCPANGALPFKSDYIRCGVQTVLCKNPESILFFFLATIQQRKRTTVNCKMDVLSLLSARIVRNAHTYRSLMQTTNKNHVTTRNRKKEWKQSILFSVSSHVYKQSVCDGCWLRWVAYKSKFASEWEW